MNAGSDKILEHYHAASKRTFLIFRIGIISSMAFLLVALMVNISFLSKQKTPQTLQSQAASEREDVSSLPSLPPECRYHKIAHGYTVICQPPTPLIVPTQQAIALPPQCIHEASISGNMIACTAGNQQTIRIPLPKLPQTCQYETRMQGYVVNCSQ